MKSPPTPNILLLLLLSIMVATCSSSVSNISNGGNGAESTGYFWQTRSKLELELQKFVTDQTLKNAAVGFVVMDLENGKTVVSHNPNLALVPASTLKLITTASALQILGPNFCYETVLGHTGEVNSEGVLNGSLVIKGSGDPSFGSTEVRGAPSLEDIFDRWLKTLNSKGIKRITGQVIADESVFDYELIPRQWIWEDMGNYFGAGTSGLTVNENMYTVFFGPGSTIGSPARVVSTTPEVPQMTYVNLVTTGSRNSGDQVYIFGAPYQNQRTLTGTVPLGSNNFPVRGSIPDPPMFVAQAFHQFLNSKGIEVRQEPTNQRIRHQNGKAAPEISQVISRHVSPSMVNITHRTNLRSVNTLSENLLKTIGVKEKGEGSFAKGAEAIKEFWAQKGLDTDGMFLFDGSGLAPANRLTVNQLAQVIISALNHQTGNVYSEGIPIAGKTGTLANLFKGTKSEGVLRAKSGFMGNVRAYAGFTTNATERKLVFALIVNNFSGTSAEIRDKMVTLMDAVTSSED